MTERQSPTFGRYDTDGDQCGREIGDGICGKPATVWAYFGGDDEWAGRQASACADCAPELLAYPGARLTSDAPLTADDVDTHR